MGLMPSHRKEVGHSNSVPHLFLWQMHPILLLVVEEGDYRVPISHKINGSGAMLAYFEATLEPTCPSGSNTICSVAMGGPSPKGCPSHAHPPKKCSIQGVH